MPQHHIPDEETRRWDGISQGKIKRRVFDMFNIDLQHEPGKATLSQRGQIIRDDSDLATLGVIDHFLRTDANGTDQWWGLARDGTMFRNASTTPTDTTWVLDTDVNAISDTEVPTDAMDMSIHEGFDGDSDGVDEDRLLVTRKNDIAILNQNGGPLVWDLDFWTDSTILDQPALDSDQDFHPIQPLQRLRAVGDGRFVHTIDKDDVVAYKRLTFPRGYEVRHIFSTKKYWILLQNTKGLPGAVAEWDGSQEGYKLHDIGAGQVPMSGVDYFGTPIIVNERGEILMYNGVNFEREATFPIFEEGNSFQTSKNNMSIAPRGMCVEDGLIYILVSKLGTQALTTRNKSGIWVFDPETGELNHKYSFGQYDGDSDVDFGQTRLHRAGALVPTYTRRKFIAGGSYYSSSGGSAITKEAIFTLVSDFAGGNRGYIITEPIRTTEVEAQWDVFWNKFRKFVNSNNRIVVKARGTDPLEPIGQIGKIEKEITFDASSPKDKFTVTLESEDDSLSVGDEVEIVSGDSAGCTAHIATITGSHGASQTITLDEELPFATASQVAQARFDNWTKLGVISSTTLKSKDLPIQVNSSEWVQFKVELRGVKNQVEEFITSFRDPQRAEK